MFVSRCDATDIDEGKRNSFVKAITIIFCLFLTDWVFAAKPSYQKILKTELNSVGIKILASGFEFPWSIDWLPDNRMLITEKTGNLLLGTPRQGFKKILLLGA